MTRQTVRAGRAVPDLSFRHSRPLTDGSRLDTGPLRQFHEVARRGGFVWVEALNGGFAGEMLTFPIDKLREV